MKRSTATTTVGAFLILGVLSMGCREHFPHAVTWPATGTITQTHAKPPEGGYYKDWDPYAATIELKPVEAVNAVGTQHILLARVIDKKGKPLPNRRVEWIIGEGSVGDIVEVDESGWRESRGYKVDNHYAISHTNNFKHVLDRGNSDPSDDIMLEPGDTWCVITSPVEGDTHIIAYAPCIYDWSKHKAFAVKHWYDVEWEFPPAATNPTGTTHQFVTRVMKHSDHSPLAGYMVNYQILNGPAGQLSPSGSVLTDAQGMATVTLSQTTPAEGTNELSIEIIRPESAQCCKPSVHIADGKTAKTWIAPKIGITKTAPPTAIVGEEFTYNIEVSSLSQTPAQDVVLTDTLPDGIQYVSSQPGADVSGQNLTWRLGTLAGGASSQVSVRVKGLRTGKFTNCANVTAAQGLSGQACADTVITAPALQLTKQCSERVLVCEMINYVLVVRNTGDAPANNVVITDNLPDGVTSDGKSSLSFQIGTLAAGETKQVEFTGKPSRGGQFTNTATVTADGGLTSEASCTTMVGEPSLVVTKRGPAERFIGRPVVYDISVQNTGNIDAVNTVVTDTLPAGLAFVEATEGGQHANGVVTWNVGTLAPGASKSMSITVKSSSAGTAKDVVTATASCTQANAEASTVIRGIPAILLEVIDVNDPIEIGATETYIIEVTNQGSAEDTNIKITAIVPAEMDFVSAEGPGGLAATTDGKTVSFAAYPQLAPKAKIQYKVNVKGNQEGDLRFKVILDSDVITSPVEETESTHVY